jgi:L-threonylcarbamoyladenylate synthase
MHSGPEEIAEGVRRLHAGRLVAFPTETVYGLGADARSERAVAGVFRAKGRPADNPLIVHVSDAPMAETVVSAWPREADALARVFWPGPLTIVLPRAAWVPNNVTARGRIHDRPARGCARVRSGAVCGPARGRREVGRQRPDRHRSP